MKIQKIALKNSEEIVVENDVSFKIIFDDLGAGIYQIYYLNKPLLIGDRDFASWEGSSAYFGKVIGRIAGRIRGGDLFFKGKHYQIAPNEGDTALHGGKYGFSFLRWPYEIEEKEDYLDLIFKRTSPALEGGFPESVETKIIYRIFAKEARFTILFESRSSGATPLSLTSHCYFNLGGYEDISNHSLKISANEVMSYDEKLIPLHFVKAEGALNLEKETPLKEVLNDKNLLSSKNAGIDHSFKFTKNYKNDDKIVLKSPLFKLNINTNFPTVVVYGLNYPSIGRELSNGQKEVCHSGIAIEPQLDGSNIEEITINKGEIQKYFIDYTFTRKE